jgi:hypothetical protein
MRWLASRRLVETPMKTPVSIAPGTQDDAQYFLRNSRYAMVQGRAVLVDRRGPRMKALDPWPQFVFLSADGSLTVAEFIAALNGMHPQGMPDKTRRILADLVKRGHVVLHPTRRTLPHGFSTPVQEQEAGVPEVAMTPSLGPAPMA